MNRPIVTILAFSSAFVLGAADLIVPKTDDRTILREPLEEGRVAYKDLGNNTAAILIGQNDSVHPMTVVDPLSIRGWREITLNRSDYAVSWTSGFTFDGANDKYTLGNTLNVTNRLVFTIIGNRSISNIDYIEENYIPGRMGKPSCASVKKTVTDKQVIIEVCKHDAGEYWIQSPVLTGSVDGSTTDPIDITDLHVTLIDSIGKFELGQWRRWARDLYNGNRGEDWSSYTARNNVYLDENKLSFGRTNDTISALSIGVSSDASGRVDFISNGNEAMSIGPAPSSDVVPSGATLSMGTCGVTNTSVYLVVQVANFPGFDINRMKLYRTLDISKGRKEWREVSYTYTGSNPYTLVTPKNGYDSAFYMVKYGNAEAYIHVKCPIKVHDLRIVGTDNKIYRISVNAGTITATEITE